MKVASISTLQVGTVLRTLRPAGEPLDLMVNSTLVAAAEICPQGQRLGLRVVALHSDD
jgi:flagellar motor switch/type III secretory pathway protein FliN